MTSAPVRNLEYREPMGAEVISRHNPYLIHILSTTHLGNRNIGNLSLIVSEQDQDKL